MIPATFITLRIEDHATTSKKEMDSKSKHSLKEQT